jgi:hypothetical protein
VLEDLEARDDVVALGQRLGDRSNRQMAADVLARVIDRELAEVDALGLDTAVAKRFDKQPDSAPGVEDGLGVEILDQTVGDLAKEVEPERVSFVADTGSRVVGLVVGAVVGRDSPLMRDPCLAPTRYRFVFGPFRCAPHPGAC